MGHGHRSKGKESLTYISWKMMIQRCTNAKRFDYQNYGGRGVCVYFDWLTGPNLGGFDQFLADVGERPGPEYSLGRYPDPGGDYEPGNVRWETWPEQCYNLSHHWKLVECDGVSKTLDEWAYDLDIKYETLLKRRQKGWKKWAYRIKRGQKRPPYAVQNPDANWIGPTSIESLGPRDF